jgi:hypothetical protein
VRAHLVVVPPHLERGALDPVRNHLERLPADAPLGHRIEHGDLRQPPFLLSEELTLDSHHRTLLLARLGMASASLVPLSHLNGHPVDLPGKAAAGTSLVRLGDGRILVHADVGTFVEREDEGIRSRNPAFGHLLPVDG